MRRLTLVLTLVLAGCATAPQPVQAPLPSPVVTPEPQMRRSSLIGLTTTELVGHFGSPALQVWEGTSLKLQFRSARCVLDAYLYPAPVGGVLRVTHVDARAPSGIDTDQGACIAALESPSPR